MASGYARTKSEIEKIVNDLGYKLICEYSKKGKRVAIQSPEGYKWDGNFYDFVNPKLGIRYFSVSNRYTLENIKLWLRLNRPEFVLSTNNVYQGNTKKLIIIHNILGCQEEFKIGWNDIYNGSGCSVCSGRQVGKHTSLAHVRPDLIKEWHTYNKLSPEEVTCGSHKKIYWICSECEYGTNLEWYRSCNDRINYGCPACAGRVVTDKNRLSILFSKIASEWDYDKNDDTPYDVSYGCHKKRWWICKNNHSYFSSIKGRTSGNGCKQCSDEQKESVIATELKRWCKEIFGVSNVDPEHKMLKNPDTNQWFRCDIYIGEPETIDGLYVEIHGWQHYKFNSAWHKTIDDFESQKYRDKIKKKYARKNGTYIEVDLRKTKTTEQAIEYVEKIINKMR